MDEVLIAVAKVLIYGIAFGLPPFLGLFLALAIWSKWDYEWRDKWYNRKRRRW